MKRLYLLFALAVCLPAALFAQQTESKKKSAWHLTIPEVTVIGHRPMKDIGVQKTKFDSVALKENIALSMADILTFNSSVFVKSYGRATLSTVAFRGTSPSHTQVTWNGMRINNPMLGMTDFSTIPSYFIDQASLLHGTSSVNETGGGIGGLVKLATTPHVGEGFNVQYVQGVGSFKTFDEFLRLTYGGDHWHVSTRAVYSSSPNDYKYTNHDKKINIYDDDKNIVGQYHPVERNRSGAFKDLHLLQEVYYDTRKGDKLGLNAWYIHSNRELPMLTTDYGDATDFENRQREQTFRGVVSWDHIKSNWKVGVKGGYIHTWMAYDYKREVAPDNWASMTRSRSKVNTFYGQAEGEYSPSKRWFFTANVSLHQHLVRSEDKNIILQDGNKAIVGYDKGRVELSGSLSAKWQPIDRMGLSVKNGWLDEQGRVYIIFPVQEVMDALGCADNKATKLFRELEKFGLIERKRRGLGKPDLIYVKNFADPRFRNREKNGSGAADSAQPEAAKSRGNKTEWNKTEGSEPDPFSSDAEDEPDERTRLEAYFMQSLEVDLLLRVCPDEEDTIQIIQIGTI